jgi:hypothetical protein
MPTIHVVSDPNSTPAQAPSQATASGPGPRLARLKPVPLALIDPPIAWRRAFISGVFGATMMMATLDIFFMMGITPFSFEQYLGGLLRGTPYGHHNWTVGFFANWIVGGVFGFVYAWAFEFVFKKSGGRLGTWLGLLHAGVAAVAVFPFFGILHEEARTGVYPDFGFFGVGLGGPTPILLLFSHLVFGATVGLFYGPVGSERIRSRFSEPGEKGMPGELDVLPAHEDHSDSRFVYRVGG